MLGMVHMIFEILGYLIVCGVPLALGSYAVFAIMLLGPWRNDPRSSIRDRVRNDVIYGAFIFFIVLGWYEFFHHMPFTIDIHPSS